MNNREILQRVLDALSLDDDTAASIARACEIEPEALLGDGPVDEASTLRFLDGVVEHRRGPGSGGRPPAPARVSNNLVLKKLRVALQLRDPDMLAVFTRAGVHLSRYELGAMFRAEGNKRFTRCSDERLLCFLTGLRLWLAERDG